MPWRIKIFLTGQRVGPPLFDGAIRSVTRREKLFGFVELVSSCLSGPNSTKPIQFFTSSYTPLKTAPECLTGVAQLAVQLQIFLIVALIFCSAALYAQDGPINYSWASQKIAKPLWGLASGDLNGDGQTEYILLERSKINVGQFGDKGFVNKISCELPSLSMGARVGTVDLNNDGREEVVVSGVLEGAPVSSIFSVSDSGCSFIIREQNFSLRVLKDVSQQKKLLGEATSQNSFFSGPVYEYKLEGTKLKKVGKLDLPFNTHLFDFAPLPDSQDGKRVVLIKGYEPLIVAEKSEKYFHRIYKSNDRMGGGINYLKSQQREVLGSVSEDVVDFIVPPLYLSSGEIAAVRHFMPLKNIIGKRPLVHGSEVVFYDGDPALYYREKLRTIKLPGAIEDILVEDTSNGRRMMVLMQNSPSMFHESFSSVVLFFNLPY